MNDYLEVGSSPSDEDCVQVGSDDYGPRSIIECQRWREQLERTFTPHPKGCRFLVKRFPHDFGTYREVVLEFDPSRIDHLSFMNHVDNHLPSKWDSEPVQGKRPPCELCSSPSIVMIGELWLCEECSMEAEDFGL